MSVAKWRQKIDEIDLRLANAPKHDSVCKVLGSFPKTE